ncbi:MAG: hypothetical protein UHJ11_05545 [Paludibacteraceae bacterium]|nr:hypothetical protein [Paludibacteraceae bacterium]
MKKLTTLLLMLSLMSVTSWADETITVSANSTDISEGLDLKVVAKLFAEAENLEQFEMKLNNPDSAFCNLDLNGDGQVDYLRVIETGEGNKRLIVLQAILAKDIYQDVASIYVEKDEAEQVSVQVIGDEYVYGANYIIEPIYIRRPLIYDWFWGTTWYAWTSPWYWGYYPSWWYAHNCWAHDWYWHHCYAFHHHHHWCSFRPGHHVHHGWHELHSGVTRRDYAVAHPHRSFSQRNSGMRNARDIRSTSSVRTRQAVAANTATRSTASRTFGSQNTVASRSQSVARKDQSTAQRTSATTQRTATAQRTSATTQRTSATTQRTATAQRTSATTQRTSAPQRTSAASTQRTTSTRSSSTYTPQRTPSSSRSSVGTYSGGSRSTGGGYSGGGRSSGGSHSGGGRSSGGSGGARR